MKEYYLQMAWKLSVLAGKPLFTTNGEALEIINPGYGPSEEGGPDFTMAQIRLGTTLWTGSIEVHVKSSLWYVHGHSGDLKYDNVILHLVWEQDKEVEGNQGGLLPCLQLKDYMSLSWFDTIEQKIFSHHTIPCHSFFEKVPNVILQSQLDVMLVERLESRLEKISSILVERSYDWDEAVYVMLASYMGQKTNNQTMEELAKSMPLKILLKHRSSLKDVEALLFGQGGFLSGMKEDWYFIDLQERYHYLRYKYQLREVYNISAQWQYKGVRPVSFPEQCVAKLAYLVCDEGRLLDWVVNSELSNMMNKSHLMGDYWTLHYRFGLKKQSSSKGRQGFRISNLLVNAIIPFRIAYKMSTESIDKSLFLNCYDDIKGEKNKVVNLFDKLGYSSVSARDSQALLQLFNYYCKYKKCLSCKVGHFILKKEGLV